MIKILCRYIVKEFDNQLTYLLIDLDALKANIKAVKKQLKKDIALLSVVKADAYGHGAIEVSKAALSAGADMLVVARLSEALELRANNIDAPILLLGSILPHEVLLAAKNSIIISVNSYGQALLINEIVKGKGLFIDVHIKIDSGMGRLGIVLDNQLSLDGGIDDKEKIDRVVDEIIDIAALSNIRLSGVYSHFATADELASQFAMAQLKSFFALVSSLKKQKGLNSLLYHCANSSAIFTLPTSHFNGVRCGLIQYGLYPFPEFDKKYIALQPVLQWFATIVHIKQVPKGFSVSYGCSATTKKDSVLATVSIGYGDGYSRLLSNCGKMIVNGKVAPIIGRVCMDLTIIDVTDIECMVGDKVILIGSYKDLTITADDIALATSTINYEVVSVISKRVPRFYKGIK